MRRTVITIAALVVAISAFADALDSSGPAGQPELGRCDDLDALLIEVGERELDRGTRACLSRRVRALDQPEKTLQVLLADAERRGDAKGVQVYRGRLAEFGTDPIVHARLARIRFAAGQYDAAVEHATVSIEQDGAGDPSQRALSMIALRARAAVELWREAPDDAEVTDQAVAHVSMWVGLGGGDEAAALCAELGGCGG